MSADDIESDSGTGMTAADACRHAMKHALEKGITFCETPEDRLDVLGKMVGLDGADIDRDDVLDAGPGESVDSLREWVVSRADQMIEKGEDSPLNAINKAWAEAGKEQGEAGDSDAESDAGGDDDDGSTESSAESGDDAGGNTIPADSNDGLEIQEGDDPGMKGGESDDLEEDEARKDDDPEDDE